MDASQLQQTHFGALDHSVIYPLYSLGNIFDLLVFSVLVIFPNSKLALFLSESQIATVLLSFAYIGLCVNCLILGTIPAADFSSLDQVRNAFWYPEVCVLGWYHYLAFDIHVGCSIFKNWREEKKPHLVLVPILMTTCLFGPIGFLMSKIASPFFGEKEEKKLLKKK